MKLLLIWNIILTIKIIFAQSHRSKPKYNINSLVCPGMECNKAISNCYKSICNCENGTKCSCQMNSLISIKMKKKIKSKCRQSLTFNNIFNTTNFFDFDLHSLANSSYNNVTFEMINNQYFRNLQNMQETVSTFQDLYQAPRPESQNKSGIGTFCHSMKMCPSPLVCSSTKQCDTWGTQCVNDIECNKTCCEGGWCLSEADICIAINTQKQTELGLGFLVFSALIFGLSLMFYWFVGRSRMQEFENWIAESQNKKNPQAINPSPLQQEIVVNIQHDNNSPLKNAKNKLFYQNEGAPNNISTFIFKFLNN